MSHNSVTGDALISKPNSEEYRNNFDRIFGNKVKTISEKLDEKMERHNKLTGEEWDAWDKTEEKLDEIIEKQTNRYNSIKNWYNKEIGFESIK